LQFLLGDVRALEAGGVQSDDIAAVLLKIENTRARYQIAFEKRIREPVAYGTEKQRQRHVGW
jgi:hypothetical protein